MPWHIPLSIYLAEKTKKKEKANVVSAGKTVHVPIAFNNFNDDFGNLSYLHKWNQVIYTGIFYAYQIKVQYSLIITCLFHLFSLVNLNRF